MTKDIPIIHPILDRFCEYIIPQISVNIKCFILEPRCMEDVLFAIHYPNLSELNIVHYEDDHMLTC